ncbi:class I SAM-dependent methyltransferase [Pasteurella bettyae]|uniref:Cyclopropane-fatty-acyl-phospholipid synthase domain protein n=1 Tax=Pasteurella bettyae CCUG 2042 TaxID=1095749 RepID=I3DBB9_9PAST|nr:methyltransferase domain-containing protein [Pasteurella bettyae]EIJ69012.1 cyclopropane-fatty-acyl-phospholipid synthase domain protein [Pasteurella bettyae CCUG 2042]SUB22932.1 methyltransferase type 11 family protein [Pasteurella bettyae]
MKTIRDVAFDELYRNHFKLAARKPKCPEDWDRKAEKMAESSFDTTDQYVSAFLSKMDLHSTDTVLDVGCGGGAISLAVAPKVKHVYALDFSQKMLELLLKRAEKLGITNITPINLAWFDDWHEVPQCDIAVSSRSSMVEDLSVALNKLNEKAKRAVYMTMTVEKDFISRDILQAIGRDSVGFPNYIYAVNILYQQGYYASVSFIQSAMGMLENKAMSLADLERSVSWSIGELTEAEKICLNAYYQANKTQLQLYPCSKQWAYVSWKK